MIPKPLPTDRNTIILLCSVVNRFEPGGPYAMPGNLRYVMPGYLLRCAKAAVASDGLTDEGKKLIQTWLDKKG